MEKSLATYIVTVVFLLFSGVIQVRSDASDHRYKAGEQVPLYANKVGPFHNPRSLSVSFLFFSLFFLSNFLVYAYFLCFGYVFEFNLKCSISAWFIKFYWV